MVLAGLGGGQVETLDDRDPGTEERRVDRMPLRAGLLDREEVDTDEAKPTIDDPSRALRGHRDVVLGELADPALP